MVLVTDLDPDVWIRYRADMRVAHLSCVAPPQVGGIGAVADAEASLLRGQGIDAFVVAPEAEGMASRDGTVRVPSAASFGNAAWVRRAALAKALAGADVIHLHYPFYGVQGVVAQWRRSGRIRRLVVTCHMDATAGGWKGRVFSAHRALFQQRLLSAADVLLFSSFDYARTSSFSSALSLWPAKCRELPFGVDADRFRPADPGARRSARERFALPPEAPVVGFVGGMDTAHAFKGVDVLIEAFLRLPESVHGLFVGDGDLRARFVSKALALGLRDRLHFVGRLPSGDLPSAYAAMDAFAFPSTSGAEAFGLVAAEAQAAGVPVVASDLPGVRTVVADGETGALVPPRDASKLAGALRRLVEDRPLCVKYGQAARERVTARYSLEAHLEGLQEAYRSISG